MSPSFSNNKPAPICSTYFHPLLSINSIKGKHIHFIADTNKQIILHRIILDEKVHIRLFNQALLKYCGCEYRPI
ncbi:MAG: hypothetical protein CVU87_00155 [Firmicutes bacterium HGW-Firmicutes-12]|nr:MAG: hypothetical protein CVU87_00155 [Firmicutes bacterium HGW-Firmicutes-12]